MKEEIARLRRVLVFEGRDRYLIELIRYYVNHGTLAPVGVAVFDPEEAVAYLTSVAYWEAILYLQAVLISDEHHPWRWVEFKIGHELSLRLREWHRLLGCSLE